MHARAKLALEKSFRQDTVIVLNIIFALLEDKSFKEVADEAGLCLSTVYRLWGHTYQRPQLLSVQKLAACVGMEIKLTRDGMVTNLAKRKKYVMAQ